MELEKMTKQELIGNIKLQKEIIDDLLMQKKNAERLQEVTSKEIGEAQKAVLDAENYSQHLEEQITQLISFFTEPDPRVAFIQDIVEERTTRPSL